MANIITTLHPQNDENSNLYPNIVKENIPDGSIDMAKLDDGVKGYMLVLILVIGITGMELNMFQVVYIKLHKLLKIV